MFRALILALSMLVLAAGSGAAQWQESVRTALYRDTQGMRGSGYELVSFWTGTLTTQYQTDLVVTLNYGGQYRLVGECDGACSDLDFELYNDDGDLIAYDRLPNTVPWVGLVAPYTGEFRLRVKMASCGNDYCGYGVGLFRR